MKLLKLDHQLAQAVMAGTKTSTWRLYDDKDLRVGDELELVDKVDPADKASWQIIGVGVINKVVEMKLGAIATDDAVGHEGYMSKDEMLKTYQGYYGSQVTFDTPIKIIHFDFVAKAQTPFLQPAKAMPNLASIKEVKLYADGGSRGNPGPSASGFVLLDMHDKTLADEGIYIGITTNNQAEYLALKAGLEYALSIQARTVHVYMDSMLVTNQMRGIYKVKNRDLWAVHQAIADLLPRFEKVVFNHVPREFNRRADAAVNRALDENK